MFLGIIVALFMGQLFPMAEGFETMQDCQEALVKGLKQVEISGKGQAKVLVAECREMK
jgi:hypothetical protein